MSWTGLDLRLRLRRHLATSLDTLADRIDPRAVSAPTASAPEPAPAPAPVEPEPAAPTPTAAPAPAPLPPLPNPTLRDPSEGVVTGSRGATPAAAKAAQSPEERTAAHWARTRQGLLRFTDEQGGSASLRALHEHSERTYFVAHVQFSRMMEELTDDGLLDYDEDTATAALTDAGRAEL